MANYLRPQRIPPVYSPGANWGVPKFQVAWLNRDAHLAPREYTGGNAMTENRILHRRCPFSFLRVCLRAFAPSWFLLLPLMFAAQSFAQHQPDPVATNNLLKEAHDALDAGNISKTVTLFDLARKRPDFAEHKGAPQVYFAVGDFYFAQGTPEDQDLALDIYDMVGNGRGGNLQPFLEAQLRCKRAKVFGAQGHYDKARAELALIRRGGDRADRRSLMMADLGDATLNLQQGQADAAKEKLLPLVDAGDKEITPMAMFQLGTAYVQLKQSDEAIAVFRKLWANYGDTEYVKQAVFLVGQIYLDRGDFLEARKLYEACSVVDALPQTRVRPGDELVVKVLDPDYYARTRDEHMIVNISVPSGDHESLTLDKNKVNDSLYTGRIKTALAAFTANDGMLQLAGDDVISITCDASKAAPYKVNVVDDGQINIDSVELPMPVPRHLRGLKSTAPQRHADDDQPPPIIPMAQKIGGALNPGSPIYVQIVDGDLSRDKQPNTITAEVVATKSPRSDQAVSNIKVQLTETAPRSGVFTAMVPTTLLPPSITTSKGDDKSSWLDIDLHQPQRLHTLGWADHKWPGAFHVTLRSEGVEKVIAAQNAAAGMIDLGDTFARTIRVEFDQPTDVAIAAKALILGDDDGHAIFPVKTAPVDAPRNSVLAVDTTQGVFARYLDEKNDNPGSPTMRKSRILGVRYNDGAFALATRASDDPTQKDIHAAWRVRLDDRQRITLYDPDLDITAKPDTTDIELFSESGGRCELELNETGNSTGLFIQSLPVTTDPASIKKPGQLFVRPGDLIWASYLDEHNMHPGYRTIRYASWLENRPTAGGFESQPMVTTAWPFEVLGGEAAEGDSEPKMAPREMGKGRVELSVRDPDAFADSESTAIVSITGLIGGGNRDITLHPRDGGVAAAAVNLVLGDPQSQQQPDSPNAQPELDVPGDDILRMSYQDEKYISGDLQLRRTLSADEIIAREKSPPSPADAGIVPTIVLHDSVQQIESQQKQQVAELKRQMNTRLAAYMAERALFEKRRSVLQSQIKPHATTSPASDDPISSQLSQLQPELDLLDARIARLTALGATPVMPTTQPAVVAVPTDPDAQRRQVIMDGPLTPGQPFDVVVDASNIAAPSLDIRLRSLAGRLIQTLSVKADRHGDGKFHARIETARSGEESSASVLSLMPDGQVMVDFQSPTPPPTTQAAAERFSYLALASDATLAVMNATYTDPVTEARMGEPIYIQVTDYDQDRSASLDQVCVVASSSQDAQVIVVCTETESHSGVFRGKLATGYDADPAHPDVLRCAFSQPISLTYHDYLRVSPDAPQDQTVSVNIAGGTDGTVDGFSRQFSDDKQELRLWFTTGQAAYEIGRQLYSSGATARSEQYLREAGDYFHQLVSRFADDPLAASADYYLGNILALRGDEQGAMERYQEIIERWPKSDFVARARFKVGQCYEQLGQFDQAADAYVMLTYHHPDDEHIPLAIIHMMNYYARNQQWTDAVAIADKFVQKYTTDEHAGAVALKGGQWLVEADKPAQAVEWYMRMEKLFATNDKEMPVLLYWHAATLIGNGEKIPVRGERSDKIKELLNRVQYDYPASDEAKLAKLALEQMAPK
jgi:TolA-binding protein